MKNPQWKAMNYPPQISATHHNPQTQPQPPKNPATHHNPQTSQKTNAALKKKKKSWPDNRWKSRRRWRSSRRGVAAALETNHADEPESDEWLGGSGGLWEERTWGWEGRGLLYSWLVRVREGELCEEKCKFYTLFSCWYSLESFPSRWSKGVTVVGAECLLDAFLFMKN